MIQKIIIKTDNGTVRKTIVVGVRGPQGPAGPEGPTGPQGPAGPSGSGGVVDFTHTQSVAATEWIINHNLGVNPLVTALTTGGSEMICEVLHMSVNQVRLYFVSPQDGTARCV